MTWNRRGLRSVAVGKRKALHCVYCACVTARGRYGGSQKDNGGVDAGRKDERGRIRRCRGGSTTGGAAVHYCHAHPSGDILACVREHVYSFLRHALLYAWTACCLMRSWLPRSPSWRNLPAILLVAAHAGFFYVTECAKFRIHFVSTTVFLACDILLLWMGLPETAFQTAGACGRGLCLLALNSLPNSCIPAYTLNSSTLYYSTMYYCATTHCSALFSLFAIHLSWA